MKKLLKLIFKIGIGILIIGILYIQYLKSDFNKSYDQILSQVKPEIRNAEPVPEEFINIYNKINAMTDTNGVIFGRITDLYNRDCHCLNLSYQFKQSYVFSWKLEKYFTQSECLNLYVKRMDFLHNNRGIFNASKYYFEKSINELNFDEMVALVLMTKHIWKYNPKRNPEKLKRVIENIKNKYYKVE